MTENEYLFSCYMTVNRLRLKRRPWWNLFGRDTLEPYTATERICITVGEQEAKLLQEANFTGMYGMYGWPHLFIKALGKGESNQISHVCLEQTKFKTEYVKTTLKGGKHAETNTG